MLALAAAIVKTAFKIWTKDSELARNTTDELIDLIKDKIVGHTGQRKVRRWVEDLEEIVNERLLRFMEYEFRGLPENERQATVIAVADTLRKARLTDRDLWEQDLDPLQLERSLRKSAPEAERDLGNQARGLYSRLLPEACAYVVSLTTSLPEFHAGAFTELLRRDSAIIARLDEILKLLPPQLIQDKEIEALGSNFYDTFTTAYRRQVVTRLDHLRLFGVDVFTQQYPLTLAYISLSVFNYLGPHQREPDASAEMADLSIETVLNKSRRLFLSGQAGSGKTTILQWLAVRAVRKDFPRELDSWNKYEPFFIPLRRYIDSGLPSPQQFVETMGRNIATQMPPDWVERTLTAGSGLILIDGIDELPPEKHDAVKQWVSHLSYDYPDCAYVVTSRPGAVASNWLATTDFSSAVLAPMSSSAVRTFVQQWIKSMRSETVDREERDLLAAYEQPIVRTLLTGRHLRELASTPLLCALLCALYYVRNGELPSDRMGVYAAAFDMLQRRDAERGIKPNDQLGRAESSIILQELAYWLIRNGLSDVEARRAVQQIDLTKRHLHKVALDAKRIYRQLLVRSGLLQEPAAGRVSFIHRTFQEYLAARAAIDGDNIEELVSHALDARWTQVVIMAAGHASPAQRGQLLGSLLKTTLRGRKNVRLALVALACLETSPSVSSEMLQRIRKAVSSVIPPRRREDVDLLVRAGEAALDILANVQVKSSAEALMVIEVVRRVKSERGLQLMAQVLYQVPEAAESVEFMHVWNAFNPEDVANVLTQVPKINSVYVGLPRCQSSIPLLTTVATVYCTAPVALPDLTCFRELPNLKKLIIHSIGVVNLLPLTGMGLDIRVILPHYHERDTLSADESAHRYIVGADQLGSGSSVAVQYEPWYLRRNWDPAIEDYSIS